MTGGFVVFLDLLTTLSFLCVLCICIVSPGRCELSCQYWFKQKACCTNWPSV